MTQPPAATTLSARALTRRFGAHTAVSAIDLELKRGEVLGFLGPNGAGKTTTMQMLTGNLAPTEGEIAICGIDLMDDPGAAKSKLGYLPETPPLYRELNVDEYLVLAAKLHRVPRSARKAAVAKAKERCGLTEVGRKLIAHLSKGYRQRVGIAQAIVHEPDVVIMDEPTVGLDPHQIRGIRALIRELGGSHSVILSTHILPEVEAVCDRVHIMHHGRFVYGDTITALKQIHSGRTMLLALKRPPPLAQLQSTSGLAAAERLDEHLYRVQFQSHPEAVDTVVAECVARNWGLYQLAPAESSLEDVFVNLTRKEEQ